VHLRGASPFRRRGLTPPARHHAGGALLVAASFACLAQAGCAQGSPRAADVSIELTLAPSSPVAGTPVVARLAVRDVRGQLLRGAKVRVAAHMSHPGMMPVVADATEQPDGIHQTPLQFTMAGDWIVHVTGALADGQPVDRWIEVGGVRAAE
jgi:hypothetical protein